MTWLDFALLALVMVLIAAGGRMGSLWTAACLAGGFLGALLADLYALSLADTIGNFPGAVGLAGVLLFAVGVLAAVLPGLLLSEVFSGIILGVVDSAFGIVTGAVAAAVGVAAVLLIVVPYSPSIESTPAWKRSKLVKPLHRTLESVFGSPRLHGKNTGLEAVKSGLEELEPFKTKAEKGLKAAARQVEKVADRVKD